MLEWYIISYPKICVRANSFAALSHKIKFTQNLSWYLLVAWNERGLPQFNQLEIQNMCYGNSNSIEFRFQNDWQYVRDCFVLLIQRRNHIANKIYYLYAKCLAFLKRLKRQVVIWICEHDENLIWCNSQFLVIRIIRSGWK